MGGGGGGGEVVKSIHCVGFAYPKELDIFGMVVWQESGVEPSSSLDFTLSHLIRGVPSPLKTATSQPAVQSKSGRQIKTHPSNISKPWQAVTVLLTEGPLW